MRVYAAKAWVSLALKFAEEWPEIVDQIEAVLNDREPAVRLQVAQNLQVICKAAPERMWVLGEGIAANERDDRVLVAFLNHSLRRFNWAEPERCERLLVTVKNRLNEFTRKDDSQRRVLECLGAWAARLYVAQGRPLSRAWLEEWSADPQRFRDAVNAYLSCLRSVFFSRYVFDARQEDIGMCDRGQDSLKAILMLALCASLKAHAVLISNASQEEKMSAGERYSAAEHIIRQAMNQLYFGSGARMRLPREGDGEGAKDRSGVHDANQKARFLADYAEILALFQQSREPGTLHCLIELYEHLVPGNPVTVFTAIHAILTGTGREEGYQFESLGNAAVVRLVKRYIADHRNIFDEPERRTMLVEILQLFSDVGWGESLRLLFDLPDLLR